MAEHRSPKPGVVGSSPSTPASDLFGVHFFVGRTKQVEFNMAKTNPMEFVQQVRREVAKVTWPTRKETTVSTVMVFIFVILTATFFFFVDQALAVLVKLVLGFGG